MPDPLSLEELTTPLAPEQVKSTFYSVFTKTGTNVTSWKVGNPTRTTVAALSMLFSSFTSWASNAIRSRFLLLSRGDWLRANAKYDYGIEWLRATYPTGPIRLSNTTANVYDFDPGDLTIEWQTLGSDGLTPIRYTYTNRDAVHIGAGTVQAPFRVNAVIVGDLIGSASSIPLGATIAAKPTYDGVTADVLTPVNGLDDEEDQILIGRCLDAGSAISPNGPKDAYRAVATEFKVNGASVCTRVQVVPGNPLTVYLGNASGGISGSDLDALSLELETKVVPLGVTVVKASGSNKSISVYYQVWVPIGTTLSRLEITNAILRSVTSYFATFPMGGKPTVFVDQWHQTGERWMYAEELQTKVGGALDNIRGITNPIYYVACSTSWGGTDSPAGDIKFAPGDIAVLTGCSGEVIHQ
jgi:hypothetical protein